MSLQFYLLVHLFLILKLLNNVAFCVDTGPISYEIGGRSTPQTIEKLRTFISNDTFHYVDFYYNRKNLVNDYPSILSFFVKITSGQWKEHWFAVIGGSIYWVRLDFTSHGVELYADKQLTNLIGTKEHLIEDDFWDSFASAIHGVASGGYGFYKNKGIDSMRRAWGVKAPAQVANWIENNEWWASEYNAATRNCQDFCRNLKRWWWS